MPSKRNTEHLILSTTITRIITQTNSLLSLNSLDTPQALNHESLNPQNPKKPKENSTKNLNNPNNPKESNISKKPRIKKERIKPSRGLHRRYKPHQPNASRYNRKTNILPYIIDKTR
jgi:hypothetical protein